MWKAPYTISEFDPLREHPEWLVPARTAAPSPCGPGSGSRTARSSSSTSLIPARRGAAGKSGGSGRPAWPTSRPTSSAWPAGGAKRRRPPRCGRGRHRSPSHRGPDHPRGAARRPALNCGGPEMPGTGHWPLLYVCNDTGNTGFIPGNFMRDNFRTVACHLFKNRRWGIIQPSCLCVGLPGTLEEARIRATVAFLAGGQIDISDTLTTLPEDRWQVLAATLPPLGLTAKPVDLFDSVCSGPGGYRPSAAGNAQGARSRARTFAGLGLASAHRGGLGRMGPRGPVPPRHDLPSNRRPMRRSRCRWRGWGSPRRSFWAHEFWSGQFLGVVPGGRRNPGGYTHPGDVQDLW